MSDDLRSRPQPVWVQLWEHSQDAVRGAITYLRSPDDESEANRVTILASEILQIERRREPGDKHTPTRLRVTEWAYRRHNLAAQSIRQAEDARPRPRRHWRSSCRQCGGRVVIVSGPLDAPVFTCFKCKSPR